MEFAVGDQAVSGKIFEVGNGFGFVDALADGAEKVHHVFVPAHLLANDADAPAATAPRSVSAFTRHIGILVEYEDGVSSATTGSSRVDVDGLKRDEFFGGAYAHRALEHLISLSLGILDRKA